MNATLEAHEARQRAIEALEQAAERFNLLAQRLMHGEDAAAMLRELPALRLASVCNALGAIAETAKADAKAANARRRESLWAASEARHLATYESAVWNEAPSA